MKLHLIGLWIRHWLGLFSRSLPMSNAYYTKDGWRKCPFCGGDNLDWPDFEVVGEFKDHWDGRDDGYCRDCEKGFHRYFQMIPSEWLPEEA